MQPALVSRDVYKKGDFVVAVTEGELPELMQRVERILDISRAYQAYQLHGVGSHYFDATRGERPVEAEIYTSRRGKVHVRFTQATQNGLSDIRQLARVLGIELEQSETH